MIAATSTTTSTPMPIHTPRPKPSAAPAVELAARGFDAGDHEHEQRGGRRRPHRQHRAAGEQRDHRQHELDRDQEADRLARGPADAPPAGARGGRTGAWPSDRRRRSRLATDRAPRRAAPAPRMISGVASERAGPGTRSTPSAPTDST